MHAEFLPPKLHRILEAVVWCLGIALLVSYFATRFWSERASEAGVEAMRSARTAYITAPVASHSQAEARGKFWPAEPDTSLWAPKRIAEYEANAASGDLPQAVLRIPRLRLEVPVYEGTSKRTLDRGAGRIEGTADIDSNGNIGIAAHRDGFFRPLKDISTGDVFYLDSVTDTREYRITRVHIVKPSEVSVLAPTPTDAVTLVTCYPFYHVGPAPLRFIVRAERIESPSGTR